MYKLTSVGSVAALALGLIAVAIYFAVSGSASVPPAGSISGTVFEDDGVTPSGDSVVFVNDFHTGAAVGNATTTPSGMYTVSGLPTGEYRVQVNTTIQEFPVLYYDGALDAESATAVSVIDGSDTPSIDFILVAGGTISGTVYESDGVTPVPEGEVWAERFDCCGGGNATSTVANGTYTIRGLASGDYRVGASAGSQGLAREYYPDTPDDQLASRVTVTAGQTTANIDFTLAAGGIISGHVYEADGVTPVADAEVWAERFECCGGGSAATTVADGSYLIQGLEAGDYRVEVHATGQGLAGEFYDGTTDWSQATKVTVTAGQTTANIDFSLTESGSISGTVFEGDGITPVAEAEVSAERFDCCGGGNATSTVANGSYIIQGLKAGEYRVQVRAPGEGLAGEFYDDTTDWSQATRVIVTAGQTTANIDFSLAAGGNISGLVTQEDGVTPAGNVFVHATGYDTGEYSNGAHAAPDGTYTIVGLAPGDYRVETWVPDELGLAREFYDDTTDWSQATRVTVTAGETTANVDFSLAAGGSISGHVYEADGVTPVADADVWADTYACCGGGNGTRSGTDGSYTITGLGTGSYRVQARASENSLAGEFYDNTTDWSLATSVSVISGQTTANIDFSLAAGGAISGTVYAGDGVTPVPFAEVWAESYDCCGGGNGGRTASDGTYTIRGLASGGYRVQVHAPEQGLVVEFYNATTDWSLAARVPVTAGQTTANIDFSLDQGGAISGTVYGPDGVTPVAGAEIWADSYECCGGGNGSRTSSDGVYTIQGLSAAEYRVQVHAPSLGLAVEFYNDTTDWSNAARVTVASGQTTGNIDFSLAAGGSISGTVYEGDGVTPVANADVWAESYDCCGGGNGTRTGSDGTYTIQGLPAGDHRVQVDVSHRGLVREFYAGTSDWNLATGVTVTAGADTPNVDFSLAVGGSISGTVYQADGVTPVANAHVWADSYDCCGGGNGTRTSFDGTYSIQGLSSGDYRVQVHVPDQGLAGEFYDNASDWSQAARVAVTSGQATANIDFSLAAGGSISGTVFEGDGVTPVVGANLWASAYDGAGGHGWARSASDGTYSIGGLAPGLYRVEAEAESLIRKLYDDTTQWHLATAVSVTEGQDTLGIDFTLGTGGTITGTVYGADGVTPVPRAHISAGAYDGDGVWGWAESAQDGTFAVGGLASGDYRVQVHAPDQGLAVEFYNDTNDWSQATRVSVTAGQTTANIDFSLAAGGSISGTVHAADGVTPVADADVWAESYECCGGGNGARTAADGTYEIQGLASGDYRVQVHTAEQGLVGQFYNGTSDWSQAAAVTVAAEQTTTGVDFSLASGGSISGAVYGADGVTPIANADVWAETYDCCGGNGTRTAADGTYTIRGLASGDYRVQVHAPEQGLVVEFYNDITDWGQAARVTVAAGQTTPNIDFSLQSGGSISGTVYETDGVTPVAEADVWADTYECCGGGNGTRAAADGTYTVQGLASGDYRVQVHTAEQGLVGEFYNGTADWSQAARVTVAAGQTTTGVDFSLASGGSISGTVYGADGVTPIVEADVWAETYDCCGGNGTRTEQDGTYTIHGLASGDYRVQVHAPEQGLAMEFYDDITDWGQATRVTVAAGQTTTGVDFSLAAGGSISGVVVRDSDGTPIAGADVWADTYECCGGGNGTRTAQDGTYTIQGLASGEYRVGVNAGEHGLAGEFYNNTTDWAQAATVLVAAGLTTAGIDFSLAAGATISGTVYESDGVTPIAGTRVFAQRDGGGGNEAHTAADGTYTVHGLAPGDYIVEAEAAGFAREFYPGASDFEAATRVAATPGADTPGVDFTLEMGASISGVVVRDSDGTPVAGADVWADTYECCGGGNGTRTEQDGTYTIQGLASGDYRVQVHTPEQGLVSQFYNGTADWSQAARVTVAAGQTTVGIDFSLAAGGSISGAVYEADGVTPVAEADVWAESYECCGGGNGTRTEQDGTYTIQGLASGDYRVEVQASEQGLVSEFYNQTTDWAEAARVTVTAGQTTANIDFSLAAGGSISGAVYEADGVTPVAEADVWAETYDCCGGNGSRTSADGTYIIHGLASGDYRVQVHAPEQGLAMEFYNDITDWEQATRVTVAAGVTTAGIDFSLAAGATISGRVYESDGVTPIAGTRVFAQRDGGGGNEAHTSADGTYTVHGLAAGDYIVEAEAAGFAREFYPGTSDFEAATRVTAMAGADTPGIDFTLEAGGTVSGRVTEFDGVTAIPGVVVLATPYDAPWPPTDDVFEGFTQLDGAYAIDGLPPGDFRVFAYGGEQGFVTQFFDGAAGPSSAARVAVSAGTDTAAIDFDLVRGGSISGTVFAADGTTPIGGIELFAEALSSGMEVGFTHSAPDGTYTIGGLPAGEYRILAEGPGYLAEYYNNVHDEVTATAVTVVVPDDTPGIDFTLNPPS